MGQHGDRRCNQVVGADSGGASGVPECCSADFQCSYKLSKPATARASSPALLRSEKYTVADHSPLYYFKVGNLFVPTLLFISTNENPEESLRDPKPRLPNRYRMGFSRSSLVPRSRS